MLRFIRLAVFVAVPLVAVILRADEGLTAKLQNPLPDAAAAEPQTSTQGTQSDDANRPDKWRYVRQNGRWWYWTAKNSWLYWSEPQGWVAFQPPIAGTQAPAARAVPSTRAPAGDSWRWGWDPANPFDRHPPGRPLNSPKSFPKNM